MKRTATVLGASLAAAVAACVLMLACMALPAHAATNPSYTYANGVYTVTPGTSASANGDMLQDLVDKGTKKKTVKIKLEEGTYDFYRLSIGSGVNLDATGCEMIGFLKRTTIAKGYNGQCNITITGGSWSDGSKDGYKASLLQFVHGKNIKLKNLTVECNYEHHSMEFIACKNVKVIGCTVKGVGSYSKTSNEEQIQFDVASKTTAPTLAKKEWDGTGCTKILVQNCKVTGCRAVCFNQSKKNLKSKNSHSNITVTGCTLTGKTAEALAIFNTSGTVTISGNTIVTKAPTSRDSYSVGLNIQLTAKIAKAKLAKSTITITKNTVKGGRQAINTATHVSESIKYKQITVKNNKCYCKKGKSAAIYVHKPAKKITLSGNKTYKW